MNIGIAIGSAMGFEKNRMGWSKLSKDDRAAVINAVTRVFTPLIDAAKEAHDVKSVFSAGGFRTEQYRLPENLRDRISKAIQ